MFIRHESFEDEADLQQVNRYAKPTSASDNIITVRTMATRLLPDGCRE